MCADIFFSSDAGILVQVNGLSSHTEEKKPVVAIIETKPKELFSSALKTNVGLIQLDAFEGKCNSLDDSTDEVQSMDVRYLIS